MKSVDAFLKHISENPIDPVVESFSIKFNEIYDECESEKKHMNFLLLISELEVAQNKKIIKNLCIVVKDEITQAIEFSVIGKDITDKQLVQFTNYMKKYSNFVINTTCGYHSIRIRIAISNSYLHNIRNSGVYNSIREDRREILHYNK